MTAYDSIERTAPDEGEPLFMNRRRRSSRTWTLVSAIVVLCLLGFGAIAVHQASVSEEEFSEGFDLAGLSAADETLARRDFGKFLSSYAKHDVDEETMSPAELGLWNSWKSKCKSAIFRPCRISNGRQCYRCRPRVWWHKFTLIAGCKKYHCWMH